MMDKTPTHQIPHRPRAKLRAPIRRAAHPHEQYFLGTTLHNLARHRAAALWHRFLDTCSAGPLLALLASGSLVIYGSLLPNATRQALVAEWGPIENLTVVLYICVLFGLLAFGLLAFGLLAVSRGNRVFFVTSAAVVALMAARELDLHNAFTTSSVISLGYYTGDTPPAEKLVVSGIMTGLALFLASYVIKYAGPFWRRLRCGHAEVCSLLTAMALLLVAQILNKRLIPGLTIDKGTSLHFGLQWVEEVFELTAPLILLWAIGQYASSISHGRAFTDVGIDGCEPVISTDLASLQSQQP